MKKFIACLTLAFAAVQASACQFVDKRICEINTVLETETGHKVTYSVDYTVRVSSVEWVIGGQDIMHLGDTLSLGDDELFFALAHEFGHSAMKHARKFVESFGPESAKFETDLDLLKKYGQLARENEGARELNYSMEFAADKFAAEIMAKHGMNPVNAIRSLLKPVGASNTHPSRIARIQKLQPYG